MLRCLLLIACVFACAVFAGCGGPETPAPAAIPQMPEEPEAALAWVREAAADGGILRARLADWPLASPAFTYTTETQVALTWRIRLALADGRIEDAVADLERLRRDYEGEGESPEGERLDARWIELGIFEGALRGAREAMEGARPAPRLARRRLERAEALVASGTPEDAARLAGVRRLCAATTAGDLPTLTAWLGPAETPARVLAFSDHFALGGAMFIDVLRRWQREGARVEIVPVLRGQVRLARRLVPAESEAAERQAIADDARTHELSLASAQGGEAVVLPSAQLEALGLGPQEVLVLVLDDRGNILGRVAGTHPDLRPLDPVVQRLVSR